MRNKKKLSSSSSYDEILSSEYYFFLWSISFVIIDFSFLNANDNDNFATMNNSVANKKK